MVSDPETKEFKFVFKKRRLMDNFDPYPMDIRSCIHLFINKYKYGCFIHYTSFNSVTLKLKHTFTLLVAGPSSCGKSTFVIRLLESRKQLL